MASSALARVLYRVGQSVRQVAPRRSAPVDAALRALLPLELRQFVVALPVADRIHALRVHRCLVAWGCRDREVLLAGLLHDIGKVDGDIHPGVSQRTVVVLMSWWAPTILARVVQPSSVTWLHGLYLSINHPVIGAERARAAGVTARVCWLIAHHHDEASFEDPGLRLLHEADEGS